MTKDVPQIYNQISTVVKGLEGRITDQHDRLYLIDCRIPRFLRMVPRPK